MAFIREPLLLLSFFISFITTFLVLPYWIRRAKNAGLVGQDLHKLNKPRLPEIGGIIVVLGFLIGILFFVGMRTFYFGDSNYILETFSILSTILIITVIGLIDDILGWKIGLRQWQKPVLCLIAALPIMVVNAGQTSLRFPFLGHIDFGILYPLLLVPVAITGASNGFNMIAGYNGLEAGLGIIILATLSYLSWTLNIGWIAVVGLCMVFSLLAFYMYNKYPAKIFPGNTLTYSVGALIACIAIFSSIERAALILFIPYFIEFFLKLRGMFKKESYAAVTKDGFLAMPYTKFYGIEHIAIYILTRLKRNITENNVVYLLWAFELMFAGFVLVVL
ncbi:TPA: glycosyl transferase family 4 [Candidatus Woesearchaeota archaeon]|nr:glycosyl transferase family 4 [Candidatus Woesearchaeota archaeon]